MPTYQRRHGIPIKVWKTETQMDDRQNSHEVAVPLDAHDIKCWIFAQRSARAEVPGQLGIDIIRIGVDAGLEAVDLWSKVEITNFHTLNGVWDVVTPPAYHHGTRHTRHWSLDLRKRPNGNN